jgi:hypothetical protein
MGFIATLGVIALIGMIIRNSVIDRPDRAQRRRWPRPLDRHRSDAAPAAPDPARRHTILGMLPMRAVFARWPTR